jgi:hypothetical protein
MFWCMSTGTAALGVCRQVLQHLPLGSILCPDESHDLCPDESHDLCPDESHDHAISESPRERPHMRLFTCSANRLYLAAIQLSAWEAIDEASLPSNQACQERASGSGSRRPQRADVHRPPVPTDVRWCRFGERGTGTAQLRAQYTPPGPRRGPLCKREWRGSGGSQTLCDMRH